MYREAVSSFYLITLSFESCMFTFQNPRICFFDSHHIAGVNLWFIMVFKKVELVQTLEYELEPLVIMTACTEVNPAIHDAHFVFVYTSIVLN